MAPGLARVPERSSEWLTVSGEYREHSTVPHTWRQFVIYSSLQHQNKQYHLQRIGQLLAIIIMRNLQCLLYLKLFCHYQPRCIMAVLEGSRWIVIVDRVIIAIRSWWIVIAHVSVVSSIERCCFSGVLAIQSHPPPSYWSIQSQSNIILTTANMILILRQSQSLLITRKRRSWWRKAIYNQGSTTQRLAAADNNASSKLLSLVSLSHWSHFQATPCGGVLIISNQQK